MSDDPKSWHTLPAGTYRVMNGTLYRVEPGVPPNLCVECEINRTALAAERARADRAEAERDALEKQAVDRLVLLTSERIRADGTEAALAAALDRLVAERAKREQTEEAVDEMSLELRALRRVHLHGCDCSEDEACMFARERDAERVRAERAEKERDALIAAMQEVAKVGRGLEASSTEEERANYWFRECGRARGVARDALKKFGRG